MRVNITYAEELEKLPDLIGGFLVECTTALVEQANLVNEVHPLVRTEGFTLHALEKIENVRRELSRIDQRLEDSYSILSGIHNYNLQLAQSVVSPIDQEAEEEVDVETEPEAG
ncbi:MAG: hypothetical protein CMQ51_07130 [Gammaproteobacteria bacterium]|nr:hypothetical protein [Gammaproteobacteria bacterium]